MDCERRFHIESLRPLKELKNKIQSELQKLEQQQHLQNLQKKKVLPPKVVAGLIMVDSRTSFNEVTECVGMSGKSLKNWINIDKQINLLN